MSPLYKIIVSSRGLDTGIGIKPEEESNKLLLYCSSHVDGQPVLCMFSEY